MPRSTIKKNGWYRLIMWNNPASYTKIRHYLRDGKYVHPPISARRLDKEDPSAPLCRVCSQRISLREVLEELL